MTTTTDLRHAAGQLLIGGYEETPTELPDEVRRALAADELGGIILFRRNIESLEQVAALNEAISAAAGGPLVPWLAIDQEGGPVRRLTAAQGCCDIPAMREVGDHDDESLAAAVGEVIAREIAAVGFNLDFAPSLDVDTNPANPIIGSRSLSSDPERVARLGIALVRGLLAGGVVPCGKHFPGHGDTAVDSHLGLPIIEHPRARLDAIELLPFRRLIAAQIPMIMTAHILLPQLDPDHPATLSAPIIGGLLRGELGYRGVVCSDDLEMGAVAQRYGIEEMVLRGVRAGVDLFLICHQPALWRAAFEALVRESERDSAFCDRVLESCARLTALKRRHLSADRFARSPRWRERIGSQAHREVISRVARA